MEELKTIGGFANLGSFGLIVLTVVWIMRQLPVWLTEAKESRTAIVQSHEKMVGGIVEAHLLSSREALTVFSEQNKFERQECEKRHQELLLQITKSHEIIREIRHEAANLAQSYATEKAIQEARQRTSKEKGAGHA